MNQISFNIQALNEIQSPKDFQSYTTNVGIKDKSLDLLVVGSKKPCNVAGVFTKNLFAGPAVLISREHLKHKKAQALVVNSKNANVGNGKIGLKHLNLMVQKVADELDIAPELVQLSSTGIIGVPLPIEKILADLDGLENKMETANFLKVAKAMMTTDTRPKALSYLVENTILTGVVKGVGMIEPNMATLLLYFFTDANLDQDTLETMFKRVMDKTFNCISIDHDTSTSDTALIFANGASDRKIDKMVFEQALYQMSLRLLKMVLLDGEGATKIICVSVKKAKNVSQAKTVGKSVINSPLVKTAIYGADPNWGRVIMAIGKCSEYGDILPERVQVWMGNQKSLILVYPNDPCLSLLQLSNLIKDSAEIKITIALHTGDSQCDVWGCDLSEEYVRFNSEYAT